MRWPWLVYFHWAGRIAKLAHEALRIVPLVVKDIHLSGIVMLRRHLYRGCTLTWL